MAPKTVPPKLNILGWVHYYGKQPTNTYNSTDKQTFQKAVCQGAPNNVHIYRRKKFKYIKLSGNNLTMMTSIIKLFPFVGKETNTGVLCILSIAD